MKPVDLDLLEKEGYEICDTHIRFPIKPELGALFVEIMASKSFDVEELLLHAIADISSSKMREIIRLEEFSRLKMWTYLKHETIAKLTELQPATDTMHLSDHLKHAYLHLSTSVAQENPDHS